MDSRPEIPSIPIRRYTCCQHCQRRQSIRNPKKKKSRKCSKCQHHRRIPAVRRDSNKAMRTPRTPKRRHVPSSSLDLRSLVPNRVIDETRSPERELGAVLQATPPTRQSYGVDTCTTRPWMIASNSRSIWMPGPNVRSARETTHNSQEIPPNPPPSKGRKMELPMLLRVPPPRGAPSSHAPATVTPAAAAAQRQTRPTSPRVGSFVPSGNVYPGTAIRTTSTRPSTPDCPVAAAARGTAPRQSPLERQQSTGRQPPPRRQSPTRDTSGHWRSVSLRGHCQASRSCSSESYGKSKYRREHDRDNRR